MSDRHLYMMCGLPFAGKSTLARALVDHFGWAHLETDQIVTELGFGIDGAPITRGQWTATYREAYRRLDQLLGAGATVVYDATNFRLIQRQQLRRLADRHAVRTTVILVATPEAETRRRWQRNRRDLIRHDVRDEDFAEVAATFQPPTAAEHVVCYDGSTTIARWIDGTFDLIRRAELKD